MSTSTLRVDLKMKCFIQLARKCLVDNLEEEIEKTENPEIKESLIEKLTEVLECDIIFSRPRVYNNVNDYNQRKKIPNEPVNVRGTPLKLRNMSNTVIYRKFSASIANILGYTPDFSDAPFSNIARNNRVYEAIKLLYKSGKMDQEQLDCLVTEAENSNNSKETEKEKE